MLTGRRERHRVGFGSNNVHATRYVTKHAMSGKIELIQGVMSVGGFFYYENPNDLGFETTVPPGYHFETYEEAVENAEFQRKRKLADLRKQMKRTENLKWKKPRKAIKSVRRRKQKPKPWPTTSNS